MTTMTPKVDGYIRKNKQWQAELAKLRAIVLDCGLTEEVKWMVPCYTLENSNIVLIHVFKAYCALLFPKGALLKDSNGLLIQQTPNSQAARQIRFTNVQEIVALEAVVKEYIDAAIAVEKAGLAVEFKPTEAFAMPDELVDKFDEDPDLRTAFEALTPGRQRGYLLYFAGAKQAKTREARIEKYLEKILSGKGLDD